MVRHTASSSTPSAIQGMEEPVNHMARLIGVHAAMAFTENKRSPGINHDHGDASCMQIDLARTKQHLHTKTVGLDSITRRMVT
ncbi:hypothetical protein E5D57_010177 [Metarhizium anisopliae]|nr:hypothetical protein E5D57_010177 [Metarhizium anisopliae]